MDLAPADVMLISHHRDRPGTVGRVGALLGAADVNISSMTLARSAPRADAYMVLALDDDVPTSVVDALALGRGHDRHVGRAAGQQPVTDGAAPLPVAGDPGTPLIPEGLDATLVLLRHGESEWIVEHRFQGQAETPLSATGRRQAAIAGERLARPQTSPVLPVPARPAARDRPLAAVADDRDGPGRRRRDRARGRRRPGERSPARSRCVPTPGSSRSGRASGRASTRTRSRGAGRRSSARGAAGRGRRGRPVASRPPRSRPGSGRRCGPSSSGSAATTRAGRSIDRRSPGTPAARPRSTSRGRSSSATTACSRSRC